VTFNPSDDMVVPHAHKVRFAYYQEKMPRAAIATQLGISIADVNAVLPDPPAVETLRAYCLGRELQDDGIGAVARFFRDAAVSKFATIADLRSACRFYGPNVTQSQIDAAVAAAGSTR
jgi:hypothetical protein